MPSEHQPNAEPLGRINLVPDVRKLALLIAGNQDRWSHRTQMYSCDTGVCLALLWYGWALARVERFLNWCDRFTYKISAERRGRLHNWLAQKFESLEKALASEHLLPVDVADQVVRPWQAGSSCI